MHVAMIDRDTLAVCSGVAGVLGVPVFQKDIDCCPVVGLHFVAFLYPINPLREVPRCCGIQHTDVQR